MPPVSYAAEIAPGLFVGGLSSLDHLQELGVTHLVSVINAPYMLQHPALAGGSVQRHCVDVEDAEEANLLQQLPGAVAFVAAALQPQQGPPSASRVGTASGSSKVLIHCAQGVSRCAAVAAACLMAAARPAGSVNAAAAVEVVQRRWPQAAPNPGFMAQLELFHAMGCRLLESFVPYKRFLLQQAAQQYQDSGYLDAATLPQPQEAPAAADGEGGSPTLYRCRKCRSLVATAYNVVEVEQGPGASAFSWRKRDKHQRQPLGGDGSVHTSPAAGASSSSEDGSLFVEPLRWMCEAGGGTAAAADSIAAGAVQGKLYCPKCGARLGSFNWAGTQSSSGAWVTPAFQLHLSKLDSVDPRPPSALAAIRRPRMLGSSSPADMAPPQQAGIAELAAQLQQASLADEPPALSAAAATSPRNSGSSAAEGAVSSSGATAGTAGSSSASSGTASGFFRYLILDCDGVLVDSERASCEALRRAILQVTGFDIPHNFPADFQPVFGMDVTSCVEYYQQRFCKQEWGAAADVAAKVSDVKEGIYQALTAQGIDAFPGVPQLVTQARELGMGVAVASSGSPEKIAHNLGSSGLAHLFPDPHLIVSAKHVARGKPAPDVYLEAMQRLGCTEPCRALVVEDAVNGLKAAKAAGCFAVAVATSLPTHMLEPYADRVLEHLRELDLAAVRKGQ